MTKLELLNVFLKDRLTLAAEEIFQAVKKILIDFQNEKEENYRLQRLFIVPPEAPAVRLREDDGACECERRSSVQLQARVKEEAKLQDIHSICVLHTRDPKEEPCGQLRSHSPSVQIIPPPSRPCKETKRDGSNEDVFPVGSSTSRQTVVHSEWKATGGDLHGTLKKRPSASTRQQGKELLWSNRKQSVSALKSTKPVKPPAPPSSHSTLQRWHSCKECGKGFSFACQLEVHMRWHRKERPYSCAVCPKSFTTVSMLKRHHRIHTGEKPFRCHVCDKRFNQSAHLNTHFRLHTRQAAGWSSPPYPRNPQSTL
ncbi:zinc finger protein 235-like [Dunckerocampus dactyliophorus]|uniref:zinc finger protein 235-like n=1 Tax=Dunckerocampus dactyliophorus TaxID=161453 RepID=UPI002404A41B|nr:zinc finger protein 235-like [Dunckerocampus dactyliophorus]